MRPESFQLRFNYHTEPGERGLALGLALLALALLALPSGSLLRLVLVACAGGPLAWAALQWLRRGRSVRLYDDYLLIQRSVSGRTLRIPYGYIRGHAAARRGGLALVYIEPPRPLEAQPGAEIGKAGPVTGFAEMRADETPRMRQRFVLTARLDGVAQLVKALDEKRDLTAQDAIPADYVCALARRRRLRDALIVLLTILGIPLYIILISQMLRSFGV